MSQPKALFGNREEFKEFFWNVAPQYQWEFEEWNSRGYLPYVFDLMKNDLAAWMAFVYPGMLGSYMPQVPLTHKPIPAYQREISDLLTKQSVERKPKYFILSVFRNGAKTTYCVKGRSTHGIFFKNTFKTKRGAQITKLLLPFQVYVFKNADILTQRNADYVDAIEGELFQKCWKWYWGDIPIKAPRKFSKGLKVFGNGAAIQFTTMGKSNRGFLIFNNRPSLIDLDDLEGADTDISPKVLNRYKENLSKAIMLSLAPDGVMSYQGTYTTGSESGLLAHMMGHPEIESAPVEYSDGWELISSPEFKIRLTNQTFVPGSIEKSEDYIRKYYPAAYYDHKEGKLKALWEEERGLDYLQNHPIQGYRTFVNKRMVDLYWQEFFGLSNIGDKGSRGFTHDDFKSYVPKLVRWERLQGLVIRDSYIILNIYTALDLGYSMNGDSTAFVTYGLGSDHNIYILGMEEYQTDDMELIAKNLLKHMLAHSSEILFHPGHGPEKQFITILSFVAKEQKHPMPALLEMKTGHSKDDKEKRIESIKMFSGSAKIFLPERDPNSQNFKQQAFGFKHGYKVDMIDAFATSLIQGKTYFPHAGNFKLRKTVRDEFYIELLNDRKSESTSLMDTYINEEPVGRYG